MFGRIDLEAVCFGRHIARRVKRACLHKVAATNTFDQSATFPGERGSRVRFNLRTKSAASFWVLYIFQLPAITGRRIPFSM